MDDSKKSALFLERKCCPICGQPGQLVSDISLRHPRLMSWLARQYANRIPHTIIEEGRYILYLCRNCNLLYQGQVLSEYWQGELYERWIDPEESRSKDNKKRESKIKQELQVVGMINRLSPVSAQGEARVLDFGAGWGSWATLASLCGYQVDVCEVSLSRKAYLESIGLRLIDIDFSFR